MTKSAVAEKLPYLPTISLEFTPLKVGDDSRGITRSGIFVEARFGTSRFVQKGKSVEEFVLYLVRFWISSITENEESVN